jgi:hypothetical protein
MSQPRGDRPAIGSGRPTTEWERKFDAVADLEECRTAIASLAARLGAPDEKRADGLDRTVSAKVLDLGVTFRGHLHDGALDDIVVDEPAADAPAAKIRLELSSADLLLLAAGSLSLGSAWLSGRVKIHASLTDLLKLRSLT